MAAPRHLSLGLPTQECHLICTRAGLRAPTTTAQDCNHQNVEQCPEFLPHLQGFLAHVLVREDPTPS